MFSERKLCLSQGHEDALLYFLLGLLWLYREQIHSPLGIDFRVPCEIEAQAHHFAYG